MREMTKTEISSTGTRHGVPITEVGGRITYQPPQSKTSSYRLKMHEPATEEERRRLRGRPYFS